MSATIEFGEARATLEDGVWTVDAPDATRTYERILESFTAAWTPASGAYYPNRELAIATDAADLLGGTVVEHYQDPLPEGAIP